MVRRSTKTELSDEAKVAKVQEWAANPRVHLNAEHASKLIEKYGPYAYDIIQQARQEPYNLMPRVGAKGCATSKAIEYFATTDISAETLAAGLKIKTAEEIERLNTTLAGLTSDGEPRADAEAQGRLAARADERLGGGNDGAAVLDTPVQVSGGQEQTAPAVERPLRDENSEPTMSLNDYARYYPADKRPLDKNGLIEAAWNDFGKGEGVKQNIYQDSKGHPTVGVGHLVFLKDWAVSNPPDTQSLANYRRKFQELDVQRNGRSLSDSEKGLLYDRMVRAVQQGQSISSVVAGVKLPMESTQRGKKGVKEAFKEDLSWAYGVAHNAFPQMDKYPSDLQLTLTHAYFGGYANIIDDITTGHFRRSTRKYNRLDTREFRNLNKDDPKAVQQLLQTLVTINSAHTADVFEQQIAHVSDTLNIAQRNYQLMSHPIPRISVQQQGTDKPAFNLANLNVKTR